ncbi:hypothetical protein Fcan01_11810 [Folsomia candida]|uniref:Uncharacterized protein n=1 Tax=Folsomia candida TaxID=158441 RepID=A0A226E9Q4_FOLCA|nr:hypothetical protein Fcan01_11810 [Folsomia candida]
MSHNLKSNKEFLSFLQKASSKQRKDILKGATSPQLKALSECVLNVCAGNIPLTPGQFLKLKKKRKALFKFLKAKSIKNKKLVVQTGGFLPIVLMKRMRLVSEIDFEKLQQVKKSHSSPPTSRILEDESDLALFTSLPDEFKLKLYELLNRQRYDQEKHEDSKPVLVKIAEETKLIDKKSTSLTDAELTPGMGTIPPKFLNKMHAVVKHLRANSDIISWNEREFLQILVEVNIPKTLVSKQTQKAMQTQLARNIEPQEPESIADGTITALYEPGDSSPDIAPTPFGTPKSSKQGQPNFLQESASAIRNKFVTLKRGTNWLRLDKMD